MFLLVKTYLWLVQPKIVQLACNVLKINSHESCSHVGAVLDAVKAGAETKDAVYHGDSVPVPWRNASG